MHSVNEMICLYLSVCWSVQTCCFSDQNDSKKKKIGIIFFRLCFAIRNLYKQTTLLSLKKKHNMGSLGFMSSLDLSHVSVLMRQ